MSMMTDIGIPIFKKSFVFTYGCPVESSIDTALILGKPDIGRPIAPLHMIAEAMTRIFAWFPGKDCPTFCTRGNIIIAETVCEINVAATRTRTANDTMTIHKLCAPSPSLNELAISSNNLVFATPYPKALPPMANMTTVQRKLLKSSLFNTPVPKNNSIGMIPITPLVPTMVLIVDSRHQSPIVNNETNMI